MIFQEKWFTCCILLTEQLSLSDCLYFSRSLAIYKFTMNCKPGCDVIRFEIKIIFQIKLFCYMTKKPWQKFNYLENKKKFWGEIKSIFHHFSRARSCQELSQTWECTFEWTNHCVLSANRNDNDDASSNNIIFTIKDTKLYVLVVTLSAKDNRKPSKCLSKWFGWYQVLKELTDCLC